MPVKTGLDVLLENHLSRLKGRRIGLVAHAASVNSRLSNAIDLFSAHPAIDLKAIFGPQHGIFAETQDNMVEWNGYRDPSSGIPVYSLYGETRRPTSRMLADLDVLVVDLQDVGARYYTFIQTLALTMEACRDEGIELMILDRPNPIGGVQTEGPVLDASFSSFVGLYPMPIRHGMTIGEIALYLKGEFGLTCTLDVIPMQGWQRHLFFDETGLPWVLPSPNMPSLETALVYPGACLLEGTNVSEGRGTTRPFEISGAPWVEPQRLAVRLNDLDLPGIFFRPLYLIPTFHKWQGQKIGGVQMHVLDRETFKPFLSGLALVRSYRESDQTAFHWKAPPYEYETHRLPFDILCGTDSIREALEERRDLIDLEASWQADLQAFRKVRDRYLIYLY